MWPMSVYATAIGIIQFPNNKEGEKVEKEKRKLCLLMFFFFKTLSRLESLNMTAELKPKLSQQHVIKLASYYGIKESMINAIQEFKSYDDQVFHVDIKSEYCTEKYPSGIILKGTILRDFNRVDLWIKLANHLLKHKIPTPKPIPLLPQYQKDDEYIYTMRQPNDETKLIKIYCTQYIKGKLANIIKHTPIFLEHLGNTIGNIHKTLINDNFKHEYGKWEDEWCLSLADVAINRIANLSKVLKNNKDQIKIVQLYLNYFQRLLKPKLYQIPHCIILGDINDTNIICNDDRNPQIIAIFDFGESHDTAKIFDLAISCAYFMIGKSVNDGISTIMHIIKGYHKILPLTSVEIDVLYTSIMSRLLISAVLGTKNAFDNPSNPWLLHHSKPAWTSLAQFKDIHPNTIANMIRKELYSSSL